MSQSSSHPDDPHGTPPMGEGAYDVDAIVRDILSDILSLPNSRFPNEMKEAMQRFIDRRACALPLQVSEHLQEEEREQLEDLDEQKVEAESVRPPVHFDQAPEPMEDTPCAIGANSGELWLPGWELVARMVEEGAETEAIVAATPEAVGGPEEKAPPCVLFCLQKAIGNDNARLVEHWVEGPYAPSGEQCIALVEVVLQKRTPIAARSRMVHCLLKKMGHCPREFGSDSNFIAGIRRSLPWVLAPLSDSGYLNKNPEKMKTFWALVSPPSACVFNSHAGAALNAGWHLSEEDGFYLWCNALDFLFAGAGLADSTENADQENAVQWGVWMQSWMQKNHAVPVSSRLQQASWGHWFLGLEPHGATPGDGFKMKRLAGLEVGKLLSLVDWNARTVDGDTPLHALAASLRQGELGKSEKTDVLAWYRTVVGQLPARCDHAWFVKNRAGKTPWDACSQEVRTFVVGVRTQQRLLRWLEATLAELGRDVPDMPKDLTWETVGKKLPSSLRVAFSGAQKNMDMGGFDEALSAWAEGADTEAWMSAILDQVRSGALPPGSDRAWKALFQARCWKMPRVEWALFKKSDAQKLQKQFEVDKSEHTTAQKSLLEMARNAGEVRPLAPCSGVAEGMAELRRTFPHFTEVLDHIAEHAILQENGDGSFWMPPMLLVGGPGIGKTFFLGHLAQFVKTAFRIVNMESVTSGFVLTGSSSQWGNARQGMVCDHVLTAATANPIIMLDEIEKCKKTDGYPVEPALLTLLEPETAAKFKDEFFPLKMDLRRVVWVATANDVSLLSPPVRSRMDIFHVPNPDRDARRALSNGVFQSLRDQFSWGDAIDPNLSDVFLDALVDQCSAARDTRRLLNTACARALSAGRRNLVPDDLPKNTAAARSPWDHSNLD